MIRITVELISAVDPKRDRLLGVAHIANEGPGTYSCSLSKWAPKEGQTWKSGRVAIPDDQLSADVVAGTITGFDNVKRGAWDLLYLALRATVGSRNPATGAAVGSFRRES